MLSGTRAERWWHALPGETWKIAVSALVDHKVRAALSAIGVIIGSASLVLVGATCADHDRGKAPALLAADLADQIEPVHPRHLDVCHDKRDLAPLPPPISRPCRLRFPAWPLPPAPVTCR